LPPYFFALPELPGVEAVVVPVPEVVPVVVPVLPVVPVPDAVPVPDVVPEPDVVPVPEDPVPVVPVPDVEPVPVVPDPDVDPLPVVPDPDVEPVPVVPPVVGAAAGTGAGALRTCLAACPRLRPSTVIASLSATKSRPRFFDAFKAAMN
jgi:hypothetical protein